MLKFVIFSNDDFYIKSFEEVYERVNFLNKQNTAYYTDPAGNSRVSQITTDTGTGIYLGAQNVSTSSRIIINWHSDADYNYLIGKRAGAWTQPMDITFYTGIRYHAHQSYNAHIFYVTGYDSGEAFSIGKGDGHVRVVNNLYVPIIYDSNNTAYYLDPASGSSLNTLTMAGIITTVSNGTAINFSGQSDSIGYNATAGQGTYIKGTGNTYIYGGGVFFDGAVVRTLLHSNNYNSYAPTLTGTGASGTWSINVTGNASGTAGSISGFNNPVTSATANTIVYRDGSGHITGNQIFGNYHNSSDDTSSSGITFIMAKFGDNYHRSASAAKVATFISGQTMNIAGSSTSCSGNAASVTDGVYLSTNQSISGVKTFSSAPVATNIAKAWVFYNMNNNTINASYNVSSVTDNGTGVCTVNFSTAMVDANYVVAGTATYSYDDQDIYAMILAVPRRSTAQQAGSCRLATEYIHAAQVYDCVAVRAVFYR